MRISDGVRAGLVIAAAVLGSALVRPDEAAAATPTVLAGDDLVASVPGFAPGAAVQRRLDGVTLAASVAADGAGRVRLRVPAPTTPGRHRVMLIGTGGTTASGAPGVDGAEGEDRQAVVAVVPLVVTLDFRVVPSLGVDAVDRSRDQGADGGLGTAGESATADTGVNVLLPSLVGAGLVLFGAIVTRFGRRRPTRP